jgi:4-hydroxy-tetrahydrodipicolinate synthase
MMPPIDRAVARLSGYAPAVPTPFDRDGNIDRAAFQWFCDHQVSSGATALVVCGTTGEAPTLTRAEQGELIRLAVSAVDGRVPVIAGAGSNSTAHAIDFTRDAEAAGANAVLSVVPYYNKPTQAGMYAHFRAVAEATGLPLILYDVPSRTACGLSDETVARLAETRQVIGLKDATADVTRPARLRSLLGSEFLLLSGDDATAFSFLAEGGDGCISVTSNVAPGLCRAMFLALEIGQLAEAQWLAIPVARLTAALFRETNPAPVKYALALFGLMSSRVRLPLVEPTERSRAELTTVVEQLCKAHAECMVGEIRGAVQARRVAAG